MLLNNFRKVKSMENNEELKVTESVEAAEEVKAEETVEVV